MSQINSKQKYLYYYKIVTKREVWFAIELNLIKIA